MVEDSKIAPTLGLDEGTVFRLYIPEAASASMNSITPGEKAKRAALVVSSSLPSTPEVNDEYCRGTPPSVCVA